MQKFLLGSHSPADSRQQLGRERGEEWSSEMVLYAIIDRKGLFRDDAVEVVEAGWLKSIDRYANLCRYDPPEEISPPTNVI